MATVCLAGSAYDPEMPQQREPFVDWMELPVPPPSRHALSISRHVRRNVCRDASVDARVRYAQSHHF